MTKKKRFFWLGMIALLVFGGIYYFSKNKKSKIEYTTEKVVRQNLAQTVSVSGKITSPSEIDLSFKTTGTLKDVFASVGDVVKKNQLLAQLDSGVLEQDLKQAQADLETQKETLDNMKRRHNDFTLDQRNAQRSVIDKYAAVIAEIEKNIDETKIYSPIDATVGKRNFDPGETEIAGTVTLSLFQGTNLEVSANVPESDIVKIKLDQKADLSLDAFPSEDKLSAKVSEIDPASTVIQDVVYYGIKLGLDNQDLRLKDGMSTDIDVHTAEKEAVLVIPARAVEISGADKIVQVLKSYNFDGTANIEKRKIETGLEGDNSLVEVKSGLNEGEDVITFTKNN
jgi:HlyD family secretion protein